MKQKHTIPDSMYKMTFGKFKGRMIEDIETSYLEWLIGEDWFKEKFKEGYIQIQQELKFRKDFGNPDLSDDDGECPF